MKKRVLSALMVLCMVLTLLPVSAFAVDTKDLRDTEFHIMDISGLKQLVAEQSNVDAEDVTIHGVYVNGTQPNSKPGTATSITVQFVDVVTGEQVGGPYTKDVPVGTTQINTYSIPNEWIPDGYEVAQAGDVNIEFINASQNYAYSQDVTFERLAGRNITLRLDRYLSLTGAQGGAAVEIDAENDLSIFLSEISVLTTIGTREDPLAISVGGKFRAAAFDEDGNILDADFKIFLEVPEGDLDATPTSMKLWTLDMPLYINVQNGSLTIGDIAANGAILRASGDMTIGNVSLATQTESYDVRAGGDLRIASITLNSIVSGDLNFVADGDLTVENGLTTFTPVTLQAGGDDQWSNMLSGADLIRRKEQKPAFALTFKLLLTSDGRKMGKTEKGALWLDPNRTSPYEFYQYWRNVDDADVLKCIRMLTFLPLEQIEEMDKWEGAQLNKAKEILAYELTELVHGKEEADKAMAAAKDIFMGAGASENMPTTELSDVDFADGQIGVLTLLVKCGLAASNGEARKLVQGGGVSLNGEKVADFKQMLDKDFFKEECIIKKGKKTFHKAVIG